MTPQKWTSVLLVVFLMCGLSVGQAQTNMNSNRDLNRSVKRNVATVLFATLGGAALGLSTLSFYGEPQEHTDNISVGALIGLIGGLGYVMYDSALPAPTKANEYSAISEQELKMKRALEFQSKAPVVVQFQISF